MKQFFVGLLICILISGSVYGAIQLFKIKKDQSAITTINPDGKPDDIEIVPLQFNGIDGGEKTIEALSGGSIQVKDHQNIIYTLQIPPGSLAKTTAIQLIPIQSDDNAYSLDVGVLVGPAGTVFSTPALLTIDVSQSKLRNNKTKGKTMVYRSIPQKKEIIPQLVDRSNETETHIPTKITANGAYLISFNSSRAEALSRLVLSKPTSTTLSILEAYRYLTSVNKHLTQEELSLSQQAQADLEGSSSAQLQLPPVEADTVSAFIEQVSHDELATPLQLSYALRLLRKEDIQSTYEAHLKQALKTKYAENLIEGPNYDFVNSSILTTPVDGFDWALIGLTLVQVIHAVDQPNTYLVEQLHPRLEKEINSNQIYGHAYCSYYDTLAIKKDVCLPYESMIQTAKAKLLEAANTQED